MSRTALLAALVLAAVHKCGAQWPQRSSCTVSDIKADPQCMFSLRTSARTWDPQKVEALAAGILTCFGFDSRSIAAFRLLAIDTSGSSWNAVEYFNTTFGYVVKSLAGSTVDITFATAKRAVQLVFDRSLPLDYYSLWALGQTVLITLASEARLEPLDNFVLSTPSLDWPDLHRFYRNNALYNGTIIGMPQGGRIHHLYYRRDILDARNLPVPATWDDLLLTAQRLNGSDFNNDTQTDYALCLQISGEYCDMEANTWIPLIMASMTQVQGSQSGWLFDPDTLQSFVDTEAMTKALHILSELLRYSWPSSTCYDISPDLWAGRCAMTISSDATFKQIGMRRASNPWRGRGRIMMAPAPGSHEVLDRRTGKLVECSSTQQCPHAKPVFSLARNATVLANEAPTIQNVAFVALNKYTLAVYKPIVGQTLTLLSGAGAGLTYFFTAGSTVALTRYRQLRSDSRSLSAWQAQGFNTSEVIQYLRLVNYTLDHPNQAPELKVVYGYNFSQSFADAAYAIANGASTEQVHAWLQRSFAETFSNIPRRQFAESLWMGLNLRRTWQEPPPPALPPVPATLPSDIPQTTGLAKVHILAIVLPSVAFLALLTLSLVWAVRRGWVRLGPLGPPSVGPSSTLVVTDVEESTQLWETLPMHAMDTAIRLHHTLIRNLLARHHGYESATEGGAFIMGFHTAHQALDFACDLQEQLMTQPWPEEVLSFHVSKPVWAKAQASLQHQPTALLPALTSIPFSFPLVSTAEEPVTPAGTTPRLKVSASQLDAAFEAATVKDSLTRQWKALDTASPPAADSATLAFRGMRLRVGLHTGLHEGDVITNKTTGGLQYTGHALALAKAVADSGQGGMTLLSQAALDAWMHEQAASTDREQEPLMLHMGCYTFTKAPDLEPCTVYWALPRGLECRLALGRTTLRNTEQLAAGVLQAPIGSAVTVVSCTMVGYPTLLAWNRDLAQDALAQYNKLVTLLLSTPGGAKSAIAGQYLLGLNDGHCSAVFGSSQSAILWSMRLVEEMKEVAWPEELLEHELCESVVMASGLTDTHGGSVCLFNGPRVKVGIDTGPLTSDLSPATARLAYRGQPMARVARVVEKVPSGQVWCTEDTVMHAGLTQPTNILRAEEVGDYTLKGFPQRLMLYQCGFALQDTDVTLANTTHLAQARRSKHSQTQSKPLTEVSTRISPANGFQGSFQHSLIKQLRNSQTRSRTSIAGTSQLCNSSPRLASEVRSESASTAALFLQPAGSSMTFPDAAFSAVSDSSHA